MIEFNGYVLRKPEAKDAEAIFKNYAQSELVTKCLIWKPHTSLQDSLDWINRCITKFDEEINLKYIVAVKDTDEAIGMTSGPLQKL